MDFSSGLEACYARGTHLAAAIYIVGNSAFACGPGTWQGTFQFPGIAGALDSWALS